MSSTLSTFSPHFTIDPAARATPASDDGQVLLHLETGGLCAINATGSQIWAAVADGLSLEQIVTRLGDEYDAPRERIEADVRAFLTQLTGKRYLVARSGRTIGAWHVTAAAWAFLFAADTATRFAGFRRLHRLVRNITLRRPRAGTDVPAIVATVNEAIDRAAVWYPRDLRCLPRSVAATWMLRRRGVPATFVIGIRTIPFCAHAWVEVDGRVVNDAASVQVLYPAVDRLTPAEARA